MFCTLKFLAPEQVADSCPPIGPAVDIYALGAILYQVIAGRPAFKSDNALDLFEQIRTHEPIPLRRLYADCPRDIEAICLKCLRKKPAERYASAEQLADDLARFLRHDPIRARSTGFWQGLRFW